MVQRAHALLPTVWSSNATVGKGILRSKKYSVGGRVTWPPTLRLFQQTTST